MEKTKKITLKVGDVLYRSSEYGAVTEHTVTSIGNKYFYCNGNKSVPYSLEDMWYRGINYSGGNHRLYVSELEIKEEQESAQMELAIRKQFDFCCCGTGLTHHQLSRIVAIINE